MSPINPFMFLFVLAATSAAAVALRPAGTPAEIDWVTIAIVRSADWDDTTGQPPTKTGLERDPRQKKRLPLVAVNIRLRTLESFTQSLILCQGIPAAAAIAEGIVPGAGLAFLRATDAVQAEATRVAGDQRTGVFIRVHARQAPERSRMTSPLNSTPFIFVRPSTRSQNHCNGLAR